MDVGDKSNNAQWCKITKNRLAVNLTKAIQSRAKDLATAQKKTKQDPDKWKHPCYLWVNRNLLCKDAATNVDNFNKSISKAHGYENWRGLQLVPFNEGEGCNDFVAKGFIDDSVSVSGSLGRSGCLLFKTAYINLSFMVEDQPTAGAKTVRDLDSCTVRPVIKVVGFEQGPDTVLCTNYWCPGQFHSDQGAEVENATDCVLP